MVAQAQIHTAKIHIPIEAVSLRETTTGEQVVWLGPLLANQDTHHDRGVLGLGAMLDDGTPVYDMVAASLREQVATKFRPALMLSSHPEDYPTDVGEVLAALKEGGAGGIVVDVRDVHRDDAQSLGIRNQRVERGLYIGVRLTEIGRRLYDAGAMPFQSVYVSGPFKDDDGKIWPAWLHEVSVVPEPRFKYVIPADELAGVRLRENLDGVRLREVDDDELTAVLRAFQTFAASLTPEPTEEPDASDEPAEDTEADEGGEPTDDDTEVKMSEQSKGAANAPDLSVKLAEVEKERETLQAKLAEVTTALSNERSNNEALSADNAKLSERVDAIDALLAERDRIDAIKDVEARVSDVGGEVADVDRDMLRQVHGTDLFGKFADRLVEQAAARSPKVKERSATVDRAGLGATEARLTERALEIREAAGRDGRGMCKITLAEARALAAEGK